MKLLKFKILRRSLWAALGLVVALVGFGLLQLIEPVSIAPIAQGQTPQFTGRALLVASDADMVATAYADAKLDRVAGIEDTLTTIALPLNPERPTISPIQVSNSVMSWPQIIAVSPNGNFAYVAEVRSRPADGIQEFSTIDEMPEGESITVVDISDLQQPRIVQTVDVGRNPKHLSISPNGELLAINLEEEGRELVIAQIQPDGRLGRMEGFAIAQDFPRSNIPEAAVWHPSGNFIAVTTTNDEMVGELIASVVFYQVVQSGQTVEIQPYDRPLPVGNRLSHARFTADGRFLLVPDLKWRMYGVRELNFLANPKGEMIAIRFEPETNRPLEVVSRAEVGLSPEGFALNPDNTLIATVNMRRTYFSPNFPPAWRGKPYSSLSLVRFNPQTGQLTTIEEYGFEGLLPEQATFDATGKSLAVVVYNYREQSPRTGAVEFWNVVSGSQPRLERTGFQLDVVRGAHDIVLVP
ncbi:beta-propeller fold lactonase family protein [Oscillatoria sp. FACHB-1407]|uniref:beta-propeller fold lactonase family protein n=1 Tax=Oscillatoria sp. FACHB-1407 TaxID=2692847 RepID=UPI0016875EA4|nr:beta-propeller fold lactonase family protein [Oscillatoria sp. FACHB-1407]MBD2463418.1 beta-propeller fold lactonase family protein [Oscillatoria sp. FACHB-1407]